MKTRALLAGFVGALVMFLWSSLAHVVLPLGQVGIQEMPNEAAVLSAMRASMGDNHGFYFFPGMGLPPNATREQQNAAMQQYEQKLAANPSGFVIYHPPGQKAFTPRQLVNEFMTELAESLLVVWLLLQTSIISFSRRVAFVAVAGIMAAITTNLPYWNWYGFPTNYTLAYMSIEIVGYILAGIVAALILRRLGQAT